MAKGMNPYKANQDMENMKRIKTELQKYCASATNDINSKVEKAFLGSQSGAMKKYVNALNDILEELFSYIDGKNSSFSTILNETIASYSQSDKNVASSYNVK